MNRHRRAAAGQQYAIVVGLVAVVAILAITTTGGTIRTMFTSVGNQLTGANNGTLGGATAPAAAGNQKPSFTIGANQTASAGAGQQTVSGFAGGFDPGAPSEASQSILGYQLSTADPDNVLTAVAIAANGTLTYTPHATNTGMATVTARVQDSGGTANGGVDLSDPASFTITVTGSVQYARARLNGSQNGTKDLVFVVMPAGLNMATSADYKAACESRGFAQNQNSNAINGIYANSGMYNATNYYCNAHCCFLGSGNSARNSITNFQNYGIPLNVTYPVLDRGCGERGVSFIYGINTSDGLTVSGPTSYSYGANQIGARDYSMTTKITPMDPTTAQTILVCQMP